MNPNQQTPPPQIPGEAVMPPQAVQQVAPEVASPQGQQQLFQKAIAANLAKQVMDKVFSTIAKNNGWDYSSRVKNIQIATNKIAQKRMAGRDYGVDDINDMAGFRLVVPKYSDVPKAKKAIEQLEKDGIIDIKQGEEVKNGNYSAYHYDFMTPTGIEGEAQIHTPQGVAEAISNHSLRAVYGEKPHPMVKALQAKQADIAHSLSNEKAMSVVKTLQSMTKDGGDKPLSPITTASVLQRAQN